MSNVKLQGSLLLSSPSAFPLHTLPLPDQHGSFKYSVPVLLCLQPTFSLYVIQNRMLVKVFSLVVLLLTAQDTDYRSWVLGQQLALSLPGTDLLCGAAAAIGQPGANLTPSLCEMFCPFALSLLFTPLSPSDAPELS